MKIEKVAHLTGHSGAIYCLAHYAGDRFFSGGFDNLVVEWDINSPDTANAIAKLSSKAISLLYLKEKNWLVAGQSTGGTHIIDLESGREIHLLQGHEDMVFALFYDKTENKLFVGAGDGKISVWNMATMKCELIVNVGYGKVRDIKEYKGLMYVGTESGSVIVFNKNLEEINTISEHEDGYSVNTILFEGDRLFTGSRDGHLNELNQNESGFSVLNRIPAHNYAIYRIVKSPCGNYLATASRDKSIKIWRLADLEFIKKIEFKGLKGHVGSVNDLLWFDDFIVSVSDDRSVIVWKVQ